jgi:hypothetical protein
MTVSLTNDFIYLNMIACYTDEIQILVLLLYHFIS